MTKDSKAKTRWGCLITLLIIFLVLGGGGYLFYVYLYPVLSKQFKQKSTYTAPTINKEGKEKVEDTKNYGEPIKENEQAGRADPFAPF